jgi:hypothetical protein
VEELSHGKTGSARRPEDRRQDIRKQNPGDRNRVSDKAADEPRQNKPRAKDAKMTDAGGSLWAVITIGFVVLLAIGIAYGTWSWSRAPRDPETMRRKNKATRRNYSEDGVEEVPLLSDTEKEDDKSDKDMKQRRRA